MFPIIGKAEKFAVVGPNGDMQIGLCKVDGRHEITLTYAKEDGVQRLHLEPAIYYVPVQRFKI